MRCVARRHVSTHGCAVGRRRTPSMSLHSQKRCGRTDGARPPGDGEVPPVSPGRRRLFRRRARPSTVPSADSTRRGLLLRFLAGHRVASPDVGLSVRVFQQPPVETRPGQSERHPLPPTANHGINTMARGFVTYRLTGGAVPLGRTSIERRVPGKITPPCRPPRSTDRPRRWPSAF